MNEELLKILDNKELDSKAKADAIAKLTKTEEKKENPEVSPTDSKLKEFETKLEKIENEKKEEVKTLNQTINNLTAFLKEGIVKEDEKKEIKFHSKWNKKGKE